MVEISFFCCQKLFLATANKQWQTESLSKIFPLPTRISNDFTDQTRFDFAAREGLFNSKNFWNIEQHASRKTTFCKRKTFFVAKNYFWLRQTNNGKRKACPKFFRCQHAFQATSRTKPVLILLPERDCSTVKIFWNIEQHASRKRTFCRRKTVRSLSRFAPAVAALLNAHF